MGIVVAMQWCHAAMALLAALPWCVEGLGSGAKIPDPTNQYKEQGMNYFKGDWLRFSMSVSIMNTRDQTYWGPRYNPLTEEYELYGDWPNRTTETMFELLDAGTMDNVPVNTKPRPADLLDRNSQKFYLRFNETMKLRSQHINMYLGTEGVNFHSRPIFTNDVGVAESYRLLPVFSFYRPSDFPIADNDNLQSEDTYVKNGTRTMLLNNQLNFMQKIDSLPKVVSHGPGTVKKGMWKHSDIFQIVLSKMFEE